MAYAKNVLYRIFVCLSKETNAIDSDVDVRTKSEWKAGLMRMMKAEKSPKRNRMIDQSKRTIIDEETPDDFCYEGGTCRATGVSGVTAGDLRTLAANDNPDDLEGEPYKL
ncbi:hypothetical protein [Alicyclobacillus suci]|uniref:hypothetical protein n=1 Tax=Alicyclobacillus suci TaxID=2816080 RepID=UPI001A8DE87E|nr:hypothetical protein [Alicyclobacillus suci]